MQILYVKKTFLHYGIRKYKKGTYLLMANYRAKNYLKKWPVEWVTDFQMFWGARNCVVNLTPKELAEWYGRGCMGLSTIYKHLTRHRTKIKRHT